MKVKCTIPFHGGNDRDDFEGFSTKSINSSRNLCLKVTFTEFIVNLTTL